MYFHPLEPFNMNNIIRTVESLMRGVTKLCLEFLFVTSHSAQSVLFAEKAVG